MLDFKNESLLVISPHADDEVLGCGGLMDKIKKSGGSVYALIFNVGSVAQKDRTHATALWKKETSNAMKFLKVDDYETVFDINTHIGKSCHFLNKNIWIYDDSIANYDHNIWPEYTTGN